MQLVRRGFFVGFCLVAQQALAQISPPGLGTAHTADWLALGLKQDLDSLHRWQAVSYVGMGRKSNPDTYNPFHKPSILVLNQELYYRWHRHWQASLALSYRRQDDYQEQAPFARTHPPFEQELRAYGRFSYLLETPRLRLIPTIRQELRRFYTPQFLQETEDLQLRTRLRLQLTVNLDARKVHRLIGSSEQLFSASRAAGRWQGLAYHESRFVGYYSLAPPTLPLVFDLGYMADRLGTSAPRYVHCLAFDVIWQNPFGHRRARQPSPPNPLE